MLSRNRGPIKREDADGERALTACLALKDQVELDSRQARARLLEAMRNLARLRSDVFPTVRETMRLTEKAYASGKSRKRRDSRIRPRHNTPAR